MCFQSVTHSVSEPCSYFGLYLRCIAIHRKFHKIHNICMFTFDVLSVCHSLAIQAGIGYSFVYILAHIPQVYDFLQKIL